MYKHRIIFSLFLLIGVSLDAQNPYPDVALGNRNYDVERTVIGKMFARRADVTQQNQAPDLSKPLYQTHRPKHLEPAVV